ncbi:MAG: STAS domain-containing protein [Actinomycetota bacterium]
MIDASVKVTRSDLVVVACIEGELDFSNASVIDESIRNALSNNELGLVIDLSAIKYIDSAGIHKLFQLAAYLEASRQGFALVLSERATIRRLFEVTHLDTVASTFHSVEQAVSHITTSSSQRL